MIPPLLTVLEPLCQKTNDLIVAHRNGDANIFYRTLNEIERLASFTKTKMHQKMVIDQTEVDDDEL